MAATYSLFNTREAPGIFQPLKQPGLAVTGTNTYYSDVIGPRNISWGYHFEWTGTPTGTLTLWRSNKPNPDPLTDNDWVQVTAFAPTNPAGSASKFGDEVSFTNFKNYRFKYVNASGTGVLFCFASQTMGG
jgi:hypothetical protein